MRKFNYFDFFRGKEVTIREILEKTPSPGGLTYLVLTLHQTEEEVKLSIGTKEASLIKVNTILFFADKEEEQRGCIVWKNGLGPFGIKLP